jgi:5'-3' exoribonuclease 1
MNPLIFRYIEGMQWVMHYYYSGVCSWGWFYDYHYAPRISGVCQSWILPCPSVLTRKKTDFVGVDKMTFQFELGKPFRPFEQLMGVLPEASKELIPPPYRVSMVYFSRGVVLYPSLQPLMSDVDSPILDFYPKEFEQDMNGKKQEWEAIVKIPFIDENDYYKPWRVCYPLLSRFHSPLIHCQAKEHNSLRKNVRRNSFGTSLSFSFHPGPPTEYPSSLPGFFPCVTSVPVRYGTLRSPNFGRPTSGARSMRRCPPWC